jgi:2-hydroxy-3-keto-5-methylthiopentenyl-1-phosphate phosphatase
VEIVSLCFPTKANHKFESLRDAFKDMLDSVKLPFDQCVKILCDNIKLDPHFKEFFAWSLENNIPVVVMSSGMEGIIRALLTTLIGPTADKITIISNDKTDKPDGSWEIKFHDDRFVFLLLFLASTHFWTLY